MNNIFLLNDYIINDLFKGIDNIFSSFIVNNLFLILIFSILLTILLFILVNHANAQKGYKMNNLPDSKKRKSENENENSRKGNFESGDSGSNGDNGDSGSNKDKPKLFLPKEEDDKNSCYRYYMVRYDTSIREKNIKFLGTRNEVEDTFPSLYSEYKKYKVDNPELDWKKLTDLYYCTWEKYPLGNTRYRVNDEGFKVAFKYLNRKQTDAWKEGIMDDYFHNTGPMWRQALRKNKKDLTTFNKYIEIIENIANKTGR